MTALAALALLAWLYLALLHGRFWQSGPVLVAERPAAAPAVVAIVPARDEAALVARSIGSLLAQDYPELAVVLVDDGSSDGTGDIVRALPHEGQLGVLDGAPRPADWAGKLWAVQQGASVTDHEWLLLTDADIVHDPIHVSTLMAHAERAGCDMVSEMVALHCESRAERALIPAFVYFFQLLYPFEWVNDRRRRVAAAAGGTILVRRAALERAGGIAAIAGCLIDDVALASAIKRSGGRIWLGHTSLARSIRPYPDWRSIWRMITRSAYVQLRHSPLLLAGMVLGLALLFLAPPAALLAGRGLGFWLGLAGWALMAFTFEPTLERYRRWPLWAPLLPLIALFYMAATIGSAVAHHFGGGVVWKERAYAPGEATRGPA